MVIFKNPSLRFYLLVGYALLSSISLFSQSSLTGKVISGSSSVKVEMASVIIKGDNNKILAGTLTDKNGDFTLNGVTPGSYQLQVSFIGYLTSSQSVVLKQGKNTLEIPINLKESAQLLNEAVVAASVSEKSSDIEKTRINTSGTLAASKGSLAELLKSSASVTLDNGNNISIRGNSNILILIDGIPTTIGTLEGIPASSAESVEIITNPGVKYDSEGTGGIINIISRREKRDGVSLLATLNYGLTGRINGDITTSGNIKGWNLSLNLAGKHHKEVVESQLLRIFNSTGNSAEQEIFSTQNQNTISSALTAGKKFSSGDMMNFNFKFMNPGIANLQNINNIKTTGGSGSSNLRVSDFKHLRSVFEATAEYKMLLNNKRGDITFKGSFSRTKGERPGKYYEEGEYIQKTEGGGYPTNYFLQIDYLEKSNGEGIIEAGLKYFSRGNRFRFNTYMLEESSGEWVKNSFFSSDLTHDEDIYSGYINYSSPAKNELSYKIGIRAEYSTSNFIIHVNPEMLKYSKLFISPAFQIKKSLSGLSSLSFNFSRRITRPTYPQINPFVNMIDKSIFETGNKNLRPEVVSKFDLMYNFNQNGSSFQASLYLSSTKDYITQISSLYSQDALMLSYVNGQRSHKGGVEISGKYKFGKSIATAVNTNLYYGQSTGSVNGFDLSNKSLMFTGNLSLIVNMKKMGDFTTQYFYTSAQTYPQFTSSPVHFCDIGYKKGLAKEKMVLTITLSDLFNTRRWDIKSNNTIYSLKNNSKSQSRVLWLGLSFNLNKIQGQKPSKKEEESDGGLIRLGY